MLFTQNLSIINNLNHQDLITDLSFSLFKDDRMVIIGEEGNGKSSLLKVLANQEPHYLTINGQFHSDGKVGYLPQLLSYDGTVEQFFLEHAEFELSDYKILSLFGFDSELFYSQQPFNTLSGGEKVKAYLLMLMINQTSIYLLDEPTNDLDLDTLLFLQNFIKNTNAPFLFITHDIRFIQDTANRLLLLEQTHRKTRARHTIYTGVFNDFIALRNLQLTHQDQNASKQRQEFDQKMDRYRRIEQKVTHQLRNVSRQAPSEGKNLKDKMRSVKSMGKRFEREKDNFIEFSNTEEPIEFFFKETMLPKQKGILRLENLNLEVHDKRIIKDINLVVLGQDKIGLVGQNGIGKTTLLHQIHTLLTKDKSIKVGLMPQNYKQYLPLDTNPIDYLKRDVTKQEKALVSTMLGSMKFTAQEMNQPIENLSGGQQAKLLLIKLMLEECNVLLLDEPTRNLSPLSLPVFIQALQDFKGCIISISHDRYFLNELMTKTYELSNSGLKDFTLDEGRPLDLF